ncbi:MAG TPA: HAD family hydrolase [Vicinamibacterales bacterium]|nr:HAD family hydrolase [Vicinamibacterales bacterium]
MRPAVFLDRDGTLNVDVGYLHALDDLELFPWTTDALRLLKRAGYLLVVISNQSGIALGFIDDGFVERAHQEIQRRLQRAGIALDGFYYCPHHPAALRAELRRDCDCRKPRPGMIQQAARELDIDLSQSWTIGDKWIDVQVGHTAGTKSILVRTGWGRHAEARRPEGQPVDAICDNLMHAVTTILHAQ